MSRDNLLRFTLIFASSFLIACGANRPLVSVYVENAKGDVELVYEGVQSLENLVKEIRYFPSKDTLSITPMKKGAVSGIVQTFYSNNIPKEETSFVKGVQEGVFRRYDFEGILIFEGQMVRGSKEGVWTTWYDEVQMEEQRSYVNNQLHGNWTYWYADGNVRRTETYQLGKLIDQKDYDQ
ncbi:MAG: hypothetical protein JKX84_11330 [Flavobacteriales bacterium]|nr:hypothetical protein [Flavobacteriales bacterium]